MILNINSEEEDVLEEYMQGHSSQTFFFLPCINTFLSFSISFRIATKIHFLKLKHRYLVLKAHNKLWKLTFLYLSRVKGQKLSLI